MIREKGTNRSQFYRGQVDKYTWIDIGSSFLPSEIVAAFLWAQMQDADNITRQRLEIWNRYHKALLTAEEAGKLRRPIVPPDCEHNAHMYYLLLRDLADRTNFINEMKQQGINCVFHYVPLHSSPAGVRFGKQSGSLTETSLQSERLVRMPMYCELTDKEQNRILDALNKCLN
jgi:dTDP-4-amino-4,6-dideoxygalactose transaminase